VSSPTVSNSRYLTQILPEKHVAVEKLKKILIGQERIALTYFEADYHFCHRHTLVEYLKSDQDLDEPVFHLSKSCTSSNQIAYNINSTLPEELWNESALTTIA
jgi:hypothetical protein